jgi:hypothetical protein
MWIEFEIPPKGVDDSHNGRCVSKLIFGVKKNGASGRPHQDIESDLSMDLNNRPEDVGDGKDDVLVGNVEEGGLVFIDPVVSLHSATAGTESGFAGEVDLFCKATAQTLIYGMPKADLALKDFANIGNDSVSDTVGIFFDESVPITIGAENIGNRRSGDDFHRPSSQA